MGRRRAVHKSQLDAADLVLDKLRSAVSTRFIALIANTGLPIAVISSTERVDGDTLASLAASAFGATRQLAGTMGGSESSCLLFEAGAMNVIIAAVNMEVLLVVSFRETSDIGLVRLHVRKAVASLKPIFSYEGENSGAD